VTTEANGGTKTVTTYRSTLTVSNTSKGIAPDPLFIDGTNTDWSTGSNPPIGGWSQSALKAGTSGTFYLIEAGGEGYTYVWWNALMESSDSSPQDLPDCTCTPGCDDAACGDDGCGGSCGTCAEDEQCTDGMCTKNACDPICGDVACGDDGCGGSCGDCAEGETCSDGGQCEPTPCEPSCSIEQDSATVEKSCGDDGCGGTCGTCDDGLVCQEGLCAEEPCVPLGVPDKVMCGPHECEGSWGDCPEGLICSAIGTCEGPTDSPSDSGGCRAANGPFNAGVLAVFSLALIALIARVRRRESAASKNHAA